MMQLVLKNGKYFDKRYNSIKRNVRTFRFQPLKTGTSVRLFFFLFVLIAVSCDKDQNTIIPYRQVSFTVNLNIINDLNIPGNSVFFPGAGYGGVIIYCEIPGSYYAFDASCTYEISQTCRIENDGVLGTCPCCESQFILISGAYPSKGPAAIPLKQYNVSTINSFTLRVYN